MLNYILWLEDIIKASSLVNKRENVYGIDMFVPLLESYRYTLMLVPI